MEPTTTTWTGELLLSVRDGSTYAEARLQTGLPEPATTGQLDVDALNAP